jgi:two-component system, LytTR family, response regulator
MTALRVVTVDDEPLALERVSTLVRESAGLELVGEAHNGLEALDLITDLAPDLAFVDVEMPELSGFGVIAALDAGKVPGVVFVTAFEHYALRAFDVGAIDYLHKPVTKQRFAAAVERARTRLERSADERTRALLSSAVEAERQRGTRTRFVVRRGSTHHFVPVADVDWIDVADNYLRLHVGDRRHLCRGTMKEAEEELDAGAFARIHRSVIVAVDRITGVRARDSGGYVVELRNGVKLRASRQYADRVRALLAEPSNHLDRPNGRRR